MTRNVKPAGGITVGQVFLGKYRVDAIIGQGGMGVVAECTHLALNERVAIKMLRTDVLLDPDAIQRFVREAQAAVKLKSEYVARVSDVGTFEDGAPYMVMEYLEGHDLGELLKQRGVLPVQWAVGLILQTAEALAEAHSLNIVHRDVKPTNLFVTWRPDGSSLIKVLDFGISKSPMGADLQLTQTQSLLGTPAYMSPEQMRSARLVDTRTDIWSLGTVLYEVLEGRRPFAAESFSEMCVKVAVDEPAQMVNTPPALQSVILRCLAKTPEHRYANMAELAYDLVPFSVDQHQATVVVERMHRMLRRNQGDWESNGNSTPNGVRLPREIRDANNVPVRASTPVPWSGGSEPSLLAFKRAVTQEGSQSSAQPLRADTALPLDTIVHPQRRRRWPLVVALLSLIGAGIGIGTYLANGDTTAPVVASPAETKPVEIKMVETNPAETNPAETKPTETKPADIKAADTAAETKSDKLIAHVGGGTVHKPPPLQVKAKQPTTATTSTTVKHVPDGTKQTTKPPCDAFDNMHGC